MSEQLDSSRIIEEIDNIGIKHESELKKAEGPNMPMKNVIKAIKEHGEIPQSKEMEVDKIENYLVDEIESGDFLIADANYADDEIPFKFSIPPQKYIMILPKEASHEEITRFINELHKLGYRNYFVHRAKDPEKLNIILQDSIGILKKPPIKLVPHANSADYDLDL